MSCNVHSILALIVSGIVYVPLVACATPQGKHSEKPAALPLDKTVATISRSYTDFGFDVYGTILQVNVDRNIFISPASISLALAMAQNGAAHATEVAMAKVLRVTELDREEMNALNGSLIASLQEAEPSVELSIANSLWLKQGVRFYDEFIERNKTYFGAEAFSGLDQSKINTWVSDKTKNKIDRIIESIPERTIALIINAIYFKGTWEREFDRKLTADDDFHLLDGTAKKVPMMRQDGTYRYIETDDFQAISLPYGDGRISMYIFLPAEHSSLAAFNELLTDGNWQPWMKQFAQRKGYIMMPRFTVEFSASLTDILKTLGMEVAFDPINADFSRMCPVTRQHNVYISDVLHKTFAEVNEEGTEAAAATVVVMGVTASIETVKPFRMVVDRPFFLAIRDNESGLILFMGQITDP